MCPHISDEEYADALHAFESLSEKDKLEMSVEADAILEECIGRETIYNGISQNVSSILQAIDEDFERLTKFNKYDWSIFSIAIALQCLRQYLGPHFTNKQDRLDHKKAEEQVKGKNTTKGKRIETTHRFYHPSLDEIIAKPVPFDITSGSAKFGGVNGDHRCETLGHDPILGYFFGTLNIMTSTITKSNLESYHIKDRSTTRLDGVTTVTDWWTNKADFNKILEYSKSRLLDEGLEGKMAFLVALQKEFIHLRSDISSKNSLPLPGISKIGSDKLAKELCDNEFNLVNAQTIGIQATLSIIVNYIIFGLHRLIKPSNFNEDAYAAKTRQILVWSNFIATETNLLYCGTTGDLKKFDLGGLIVTIWRIVKDFDTIEKLQTNFRRESFQKFLNDPMNNNLLCYLP